MQISLRLAEHGWSDLDLWLDDQRQDFCITHIFNSPLVDIADAMLALSRGEPETSFTLHEEPGEHTWVMSQIPEEQHLLLVEIRSYPENFEVSKSAYKIIEFRVEREFFIQSFVLELNKIAYQISNPRFAKERDSDDFPWESLKELRHGKPRTNKANKSRSS